MNPQPAEIGDPIADIDTPALIVDLDALNRNIVKMAEFAPSTGVRVRPHAKTHKSAAIALRQIANGAVDQCVQKAGEAEALVRGGVNASRARRPRLMRQLERAADASCEIASGAGTATFAFAAESGVYNELQVGSYVFMDTDYAKIGSEDGGPYNAFEHNLFVLASVISTPAANRAVVDAGLKSYSGERGPPWVHGLKDVELTAISDEHGKLTLGPKAKRLSVGEKVWLIPGHCDPSTTDMSA
jgi:D-serine deaminase-like pyridoxal phosphate-dependent protein